MFSSIGNANNVGFSQDPAMIKYDQRLKRDEQQDLCTAIGMLYEFKKQLDELHPSCTRIIEKIIQSTPY